MIYTIFKYLIYVKTYILDKLKSSCKFYFYIYVLFYIKNK